MFYAMKVFLVNGDWGYFYACPPRLEKEARRGIREFDTYDQCVDYYYSTVKYMTFDGVAVARIETVKCG